MVYFSVQRDETNSRVRGRWCPYVFVGGLHDMSNCFCAACAEMHERRTLSSDGKVTGGASCIVDGGRWGCLFSFVCWKGYYASNHELTSTTYTFNTHDFVLGHLETFIHLKRR